MATDNLSYQEVKDHNELMSSMRNVMSKASVLFNKFNPNQIAEHNSSTNSHADIRRSIASIESELGSGNTEISNSIDTLRSDTTSKLAVVDSKITSIESLNASQTNSITTLSTTTTQLSRDSATQASKITNIESSISSINSTNNTQDTNISKLQSSVNTINTTVKALTSAELTELMNSKFTKDTVRDGGMWKDESYVPFVNEDNLRDGIVGDE